jgi:hypothetical protein
MPSVIAVDRSLSVYSESGRFIVGVPMATLPPEQVTSAEFTRRKTCQEMLAALMEGGADKLRSLGVDLQHQGGGCWLLCHPNGTKAVLEF